MVERQGNTIYHGVSKVCGVHDTQYSRQRMARGRRETPASRTQDRLGDCMFRGRFGAKMANKTVNVSE
jgi:hypothetical protein